MLVKDLLEAPEKLLELLHGHHPENEVRLAQQPGATEVVVEPTAQASTEEEHANV